MRRVSCASTRSLSRSRGSSAAARIADSVISWNTIRLTGTLRLERLQQVPGDGLALAVTVRRQVELVDVLEQRLELGDRALLLRADDVERLEVVVDVDAEARPRLALVLGGHVGGARGRSRMWPTRRLDDVAGAQVAGDFARLGRRLDYDESPNPAVAAATVLVSHLCLRSTSLLPSSPLRATRSRSIRPMATDNFALRGEPTQTGSSGEDALNTRPLPERVGVPRRFPHVLYQAR